MVLHREDRQLAVPHPLRGAVVEVHVRLDQAELLHGARIDREAVVLGRDLDPAGREVLDRLVRAAVAAVEFVGPGSEREGQKLVLQVPKAETPAITARLLAELPVLDLSVEDPPIEEVIDRMFQERAV